MRRARIIATGSFLPERIIPNEELSQFSPEARAMIEEKTGVRARRHAADSQCTSDLAVEAARMCLQRAGLEPRELQGIILSTSSPDRMQPATATRLQYLLGAADAFAFDINSVCSGSSFGICLADSMVRSGACGNLLLVASEMYSKILNPKDFATYPFFGDGAGAVLFQAADDGERGVLHSCLATDGSGDSVICVPAGGTMLPFGKITNPRSAYFRMKDEEVFKFTMDKGPEIIRRVLDESGTEPAIVKSFICHQANINILHGIADLLGVAREKFLVNLDRYGNTASASVLIALDEAICAGLLGPGDLVVTAAFGGGLSWGANLLRL